MSLDKITQMAGDPPLPKGMELREDGEPVEETIVTLKDRNYVQEILEALSELELDVAVDHMELVEDRGSLPQINLILTVRGG